jgi:hypothetical protein
LLLMMMLLFRSFCLQNHLQHVYAEAPSWLFPAAIRQIPGVFWRIHYFNGEERIIKIAELCLLINLFFMFRIKLNSHQEEMSTCFCCLPLDQETTSLVLQIWKLCSLGICFHVKYHMAWGLRSCYLWFLMDGF